MRAFVLLVGAALSIAAGHFTSAIADSYPSRAIRVVVPFSAGGAPDLVARAVAAQLERQMKQPVIIENRAGGNSVVGALAVARADPDGYTLLQAAAAFVINPSVKRNLPYDTFKDFRAIASVGVSAGYLIIVNDKLPVKNLADLIAYARKNHVVYGSPGVGNTIHLAAESFNLKAGIKMQHAPFRGMASALNALLANTIQVVFMPPAAAMSFIQDGKVRAIAFTGSKPPTELPNVPLTSATVPGYQVEGSWQIWLAPAKTADAIVNKLNAEVAKAMGDPKVHKLVIASGYVPNNKSPAELDKFLREEAERYAVAVRAAKIEPQ